MPKLQNNEITLSSRSRINSASARNEISRQARQCKGAAEKRVSCILDADRAVFGSARRGQDFVSAQFAKRA